MTTSVLLLLLLLLLLLHVILVADVGVAGTRPFGLLVALGTVEPIMVRRAIDPPDRAKILASGSL